MIWRVIFSKMLEEKTKEAGGGGPQKQLKGSGAHRPVLCVHTCLLAPRVFVWVGRSCGKPLRGEAPTKKLEELPPIVMLAFESGGGIWFGHRDWNTSGGGCAQSLCLSRTNQQFQRGAYWRLGVALIHSLHGTNKTHPLETPGASTMTCSGPCGPESQRGPPAPALHWAPSSLKENCEMGFVPIRACISWPDRPDARV